MKSSVIVFPGSNCDRDVAVALEKFQIKNHMVWHNDSSLPRSDLVVLPGGFSYGDYLRTGCIAGKSRIIDDVIKHTNKGGLLLGICNAFLKELNAKNKFCLNYNKKNIIKLPIAHNEGNYFANDDLLRKLEDENLIAFKYCNELGDINESCNPNGSSNNIAGILNNKKNILGMMPHPERFIDPLLSGEDGSIMFESLLKSK